jgi:hypothetical protein
MVKLLDYEARSQELDASENPFSIVVKAHLKAQSTTRKTTERRQWKLALVREMYARDYSAQDVINLFRFIDWIMVLPESAEALFWEEVQLFEANQPMPYITSVERIGIRKGKEIGLQEGKAALILIQATAKFGEIAPELREEISTLPLECLDELAIALLNFQTLEDLTTWLQ